MAKSSVSPSVRLPWHRNPLYNAAPLIVVVPLLLSGFCAFLWGAGRWRLIGLLAGGGCTLFLLCAFADGEWASYAQLIWRSSLAPLLWRIPLLAALVALSTAAVFAAGQFSKGSWLSRSYAAGLALGSVYVVMFAIYWGLVGFAV